MNITKPIARNAMAYPERTALIVDGKHYTYRSLWQVTNLVSARFSDVGVRRGDVVALGLTRCEQIVPAVLALARMGATASPYVTQHENDPHANLLLRHGARFVLADAGYRFDNAATPLVEQLDSRAVFARPHGGTPQVPLMATDVDNLPWWIGLTSGTSGAPKSVARTHAREEMLSAVYPGAEHEYYQRVCVWQNCLTSFGLSAILRILQEGTAAILSPDLTSKSFLARLRADRPTCVITSTGTAMKIVRDLRALTENRESYKSIVSRFVMGGSVAPPQLIADIQEMFCDQVEVRYASSESGLLAVVDEEVRKQRPKSHGRLYPWVQADAVDEDDKILPPGHVGNLRFKTPFTVDGYVNDSGATSRFFRGGWHHPGDRGAVDAAGYLYLTGRIDTVLNLGGNKLDAQTIEAALNSHPAVLESVVVPFAKREGELPMLIAVVVTSEDVDADALKQLCLEKIGNTTVPFKVVFTAALPKNESGKVMRRAVQSGLRVAKKDPP